MLRQLLFGGDIFGTFHMDLVLIMIEVYVSDFFETTKMFFFTILDLLDGVLCGDALLLFSCSRIQTLKV